jgi:hypothetical protein
LWFTILFRLYYNVNSEALPDNRVIWSSLLPMDMLNYSCDPNVELLNFPESELGNVEMMALRRIEKDEELCHN